MRQQSADAYFVEAFVSAFQLQVSALSWQSVCVRASTHINCAGVLVMQSFSPVCSNAVIINCWLFYSCDEDAGE